MLKLGQMRTETADLKDDTPVVIVTPKGRFEAMTLGEHRKHSIEGKDEDEIRLMDEATGSFCNVRGFRIEDGLVILTQGDTIEKGDDSDEVDSN